MLSRMIGLYTGCTFSILLSGISSLWLERPLIDDFHWFSKSNLAFFNVAFSTATLDCQRATEEHPEEILVVGEFFCTSGAMLWGSHVENWSPRDPQNFGSRDTPYLVRNWGCTPLINGIPLRDQGYWTDPPSLRFTAQSTTPSKQFEEQQG